MILTYHPGDSLAHRLDPRTKLFVQAAFALAIFAHTTPRGLAVFTVVTGGILAAGRVSPADPIRGFAPALPFLLIAPLVRTVSLSPLGIDPAAAVEPALASYRVLLVLVVSGVYLRTTSVRDSRAAVERLLPGRIGRFFGVGVALVFRFFPVLLADLRRVREASKARLGNERSLSERMRIIGTAGVRRAFARSDRLSLALRARCFAWNPTLPGLRLERRDYPVLVVGVAFVASVFV
ncbi:cobalt ABC transporter permease cbiq [Halogeometricum borinquense DSM 11551]|uniref:ABC-type cobalt transport system, permease component CbiQ n=2 Tax=Halogeometricum borinquense TaxID=60847 RepID=E4NRK5_HALBP|nr:ABC-type cobalt transport system, permease component CbiQ [Halogeometricum borinquense DSM 11551]ELY27011.1 cobalt ABC transporter permease cbiq [Halogeometricum borinquense DSM 11551]RYJ15129.1 energy-coupling factor transporter transmembrane protein EcfT [Halogeometricum borinquense]